MKKEAIPVYLFSFFMIMPLAGLFPVLPAIRDELNASYFQISVVVAAVGVIRVFFALPSGVLADRFNKKNILLLSGGFCVMGLIILACAQNVFQLVVGRILIGVSSIVCNIAVLVVLAQIAGSKNKGAMLSMNNVVHYAGAIVSPAVAGVLTGRYNWRLPFVVFSMIVAASMLVLVFTFHEQRTAKSSDKNNSGQYTPKLNATSLKSEVFKLMPVYLVGVFVFFYRGSFQHTLIPFYGKDVFHLSVETLGFYMSLMSIVATVCIFLLGLLSDRYGRKAVLLPATFFSMLAVLVLLLPKGLHPMMLSCILVGVGAVISSMPNILISDLASPGSVGKLMGINRIFADSGYFVGTIVTGMIMDHFGFVIPLFVLVVFALLTILVTIFFINNKPG